MSLNTLLTELSLEAFLPKCLQAGYDSVEAVQVQLVEDLDSFVEDTGMPPGYARRIRRKLLGPPAAGVTVVRPFNRFGIGLDHIGLPTMDFQLKGYVSPVSLRAFCGGLPLIGKRLLDEATKKAKESGVVFDVAAPVTMFTLECDLYKNVTRVMRAGPGPEFEALKPYVHFLDTALSQLPEFHGPSFRGIDCKVNYKTGEVVCWPALSSSSADANVALDFLKGKEGSLFMVQGRTGRRVKHLSTLPDEDEVLFRPNCRFNVRQATPAVVAMFKAASKMSLEGVDLWELTELKADGGAQTKKANAAKAANAKKTKATQVAAEKTDAKKDAALLATMKETDEYGWTPLHFAALGGQLQAVRALLRVGADVQVKDKGGFTALMHAAIAGHEGVARVLIESGGEVNTKDNDGYTALMNAARNGNEAVARLLIESGGEVNTKDNAGYTALMRAAMYGHEAVARVLIESGGEVNTKHNDGCTALMIAAMYGHEAVARLLIESGGEVNTKANAGGYTALMYAASNGHEGVARVLIESGGEVNTKNNRGSTALRLAIQEGHKSTIATLKAAGATDEGCIVA